MEKLTSSTISKILVLLVILSTVTLASVQVLSPVEKTLEPNETLDLTQERAYGLPVNIEIEIEKRNWEEVTSDELTPFIRERGDILRIYLGNTPNEEGIHNSTITFVDEEGETQENTIKYELVEKTLSVDMEYPVRRRLPPEESPIIGKAAPGQKITLLIKTDSTREFSWQEANILGRDSNYTIIPRDKDLEDILPPRMIEEKQINALELIALETKVPRTEGEHNLELELDSIWTDRAIRNVTIDVDKNAFGFETQDMLKTAGESSKIQGEIKSNSIAPETFTYSPITLPKEWVESEREKTKVKVIPGETKQFTLPIRINQEGRYTAEYQVMDSQGIIVDIQKSTITVNPTLSSKLHGMGRGHSLTLPILQPFYSLLTLFS